MFSRPLVIDVEGSGFGVQDLNVARLVGEARERNPEPCPENWRGQGARVDGLLLVGESRLLLGRVFGGELDLIA